MEKVVRIGKLIIVIILLPLIIFTINNREVRPSQIISSINQEETVEVMIKYEFKDLTGYNCVLKESDIFKSKGKRLLLMGKGGIWLDKNIIEDYLLIILKDFAGGAKRLPAGQRNFYDSSKTHCFINISGETLIFGVIEEEIFHVTGGEFVETEIMRIDGKIAEEIIFYMGKYISNLSH